MAGVRLRGRCRSGRGSGGCRSCGRCSGSRRHVPRSHVAHHDPRLWRRGRCEKISRQLRSNRWARGRCQRPILEPADEEHRECGEGYHPDRKTYRAFETAAACGPGQSLEPSRVDSNRCSDHLRHLLFAVAPSRWSTTSGLPPARCAGRHRLATTCNGSSSDVRP
jgi:hypothetical protein